MSESLLVETWATMDHYELQSISSATLLQGIRSAATEIERLRLAITAWEGSAQHGHPSPCNMGPLCPYCEIHRLRAERDEARETAREMYTDVAQYDPCDHCPEWKKSWPWLEE